MGYIPKFKVGHCDCGAVGNGRKVGKVFYCFLCYNKMKTTEQMVKSIKRDDNRRAIINSEPKIRLMADREVTDRYNELDRWFKECRKEMKGICANCGGKSCRDDDKYYKFSIAHLLPKAYFKSVATHPDNWVELCHFGNSCHTNFDNHMIDLIDLHCFDSVIEKFVKMYPYIAKEERRRIPSILLEYIEVEK